MVSVAFKNKDQYRAEKNMRKKKAKSKKGRKNK